MFRYNFVKQQTSIDCGSKTEFIHTICASYTVTLRVNVGH